MTAPPARPDIHHYQHGSRFKEKIMKSRSYAVGWLFLALASLGWGQSQRPCPNLSGQYRVNNWCGPYTILLTTTSNNKPGCLTGTGASGCANSPNKNVGF